LGPNSSAPSAARSEALAQRNNVSFNAVRNIRHHLVQVR
jgi:hypothetical protein